ncbi:MAG: hypothetical protein LBT76_04405 [Tannerella sp.]|jgi:hypothetical protein|nr:hypothetical protein [Tannerella sp.]
MVSPHGCLRQTEMRKSHAVCRLNTFRLLPEADERMKGFVQAIPAFDKKETLSGMECQEVIIFAPTKQKYNESIRHRRCGRGIGSL